jgi:hypothetical protein
LKTLIVVGVEGSNPAKGNACDSVVLQSYRLYNWPIKGQRISALEWRGFVLSPQAIRFIPCKWKRKEYIYNKGERERNNGM